jgi:hypothetical protein
MYAKLFEKNSPLVITDATKYPCPSLPVPNQVFQTYIDEPVFQNREYFQHDHHQHTTPMATAFPQMRFQTLSREEKSDERLLPVLDCRFNLREICKQSILLEDHLSHEEKRCTDCCIKHFLALEGLCEEAVTLDKNSQYTEIRNLAKKIRDLQKMWYNDPEKNSHHCSQELRKLRKQFQMTVFPMIFENDNACSDGVCRIKK